MGKRLSVQTKNMRATAKAFKDLPKDARKDLRARSQEVAELMVPKVKADARANAGRQASKVIGSVRATKGQFPTVTAGGRGQAGNEVLFGTIFGMTRKTGWYARRRYFKSTGSQFRPHRGQNSYWFFRSWEAEQDFIYAKWSEAADTTIRKWAAAPPSSE